MCEEKKVLISIIIPVYNTPKDFFKNCIESIICTEFRSYEIVVIDDGSSESNSEYYKEISQSYENIVYFRKSNGGVSSARNQGIRMAKGEYITFVDADDVVTSNFLVEAEGLIEKYNSDIIIGTIEFENMSFEPQGVEEELYLPITRIDALKKCFLEIPQQEIPYGIMGSPCGKVYKKNVILKTMFSEKITHLEDQLFIRKVFDIVETAVLVPNVWYLYNQNEFSAIHNVTPGKYLEKLHFFFEEWEDLNEKETEEIRIWARVRSIQFFFVSVNDIVAREGLKFSERIRQIENLYQYRIFANLAKELPVKCNTSNYERFELFLIKYRLKYMIFFLVYSRRTIRKMLNLIKHS